MNILLDLKTPMRLEIDTTAYSDAELKTLFRVIQNPGEFQSITLIGGNWMHRGSSSFIIRGADVALVEISESERSRFNQLLESEEKSSARKADNAASAD